MDPKIKAKELVEKFKNHCDRPMRFKAKQCALICVDEILQTPLTHYPKDMGAPMYSANYWQQVKQEIEKL